MILANYRDIERLTADEQLSRRDEERVAQLEQAIVCAPNNLGLQLKKAFIFYQAHLDGRAIATLNAILEQHPECIEAYMWLAEFLLFHWADAEEAIPLLSYAMTIDPNRAELHYLLGCAYQKQNKYEDAIIVTRQAIALQPSWPHPRMCLMDYLQEVGRRDEICAELTAFDRYADYNLADPDDEMESYYETLITGRHFGEHARQWLDRIRERCGHGK